MSVGSRSLTKELARVNVQKNRILALSITAKLNSKKNQLSSNEIDDLKSQRTQLEKLLSSSEKLISYPFPTTFYSDLIDEISGTNLFLVNDVGGKVLKPIKARFQANTYIVKRLIDGGTTLSVANDTDFAFLGGKNILQLSTFKLRGLH